MALNINEQSLISNFVNLGISLNAKNNAMIVEIEEKIIHIYWYSILNKIFFCSPPLKELTSLEKSSWPKNLR